MSRVQGIVKWFNKKQGYGFIHVLNGENKEKDVFVHYSTIRSKDASDYKYLVQGEYVEFTIEKATKENHEFNAVDITGICEYPTLCETRRLALFRGEEEQEGSAIPRRRERTERSDRERPERGERTDRERKDKDGFQKVTHRKTK